ncbi:MAG: hypothetical protein JF571_04010 [Asticcacaulis sp.]|nr:hypothetical protein [Asticcacaulis sp.]
MSIRDRLDTAINKALAQGHDVIELDISTGDYEDLTGLVDAMDDDELEQSGIDLDAKRYRGHRLVLDPDLPESGIIRDDGAEALPDDDMAVLSERGKPAPATQGQD